MRQKYTLDYFIKFLGSIPAKKWTTGMFQDKDGKKCVLGHCGARVRRRSKKSDALMALSWGGIMDINDGDDSRYQQKTPKARVLAYLAFLKDLKKRERERA